MNIPNRSPLDDLAERINAEHEAARSSFHKGFEHALKAGDLLIEGKAQVGHGGWLVAPRFAAGTHGTRTALLFTILFFLSF